MVDISHASQIGLERQVDHFLWRAHFGHVIGINLLPGSVGSNVREKRGACSPMRAWQSISRVTPANQRKLQAESQRAPTGILVARPLLRIALPIKNAALPKPPPLSRVIVVLSGILARTMREIVRVIAGLNAGGYADDIRANEFDLRCCGGCHQSKAETDCGEDFIHGHRHVRSSLVCSYPAVTKRRPGIRFRL
jgi:hypothetical protein